MQDENTVTPFETDVSPSFGASESRRTTMTLEQCLAGWLDEVTHRSESAKTTMAYRDTMDQFRATLQAVGVDLDSDPGLVAPLAQGWASQSVRPGVETVAPTTFNQRKSILSSFYKYAIRHQVLHYNPLERVRPRTIRKKQAARPLSTSRVKKGLSAIDRETLEGKRDYTLLALALATGRRASELAALRYRHIQKNGETCTIVWERCKGNKEMMDVLPARTTTLLYDYLYAVYGAELGTLAGDAPIWVSFSHQNTGEAVGYKTVARICEAHFGTSKVHATRHTWAVTMHKKGATLADIGKGLGHSNLKTTSDYLNEQLGYENAYATQLEDEFEF